MATQLAQPRLFDVEEFLRMGELGVLPERGVELMDGRIVFGAGRPWRFSVEDYYRLAEAGILGEDEHVELIEGEIIKMSPIGSRHAGVVKRLVAVLSEHVGRTAILSVQDPLRLGSATEPQPDLMLLRPRSDYYTRMHPTPGDVLLLIEVADSSLDRDRYEKAELYARAGIPEYWLVDVNACELILHLQPSGLGYLQVETKQPHESWTAQALPQLTLRGADVFG